MGDKANELHTDKTKLVKHEIMYYLRMKGRKMACLTAEKTALAPSAG